VEGISCTATVRFAAVALYVPVYTVDVASAVTVTVDEQDPLSVTSASVKVR